MRQLFNDLRRIESSLIPLLIEGESGTGKELVARAVHDRSRCAAGPMVAVNCGALDRTFARSELFGHRKGAFTGAVDGHVGAFESAQDGSLFLDEIGELPLEVQPILLRTLESGTICRLGEATEREVRVRVIAATHRNLQAEVRAHRFREDLFFRLSVAHVKVPPLRERLDDIELLVQEFSPSFPRALLNELTSRPWRGNVRELKNAIESYAVFKRLPKPFAELPTDSHATELSAFSDPARSYNTQKQILLRCFQRSYFHKMLLLTGGNKAEAARRAGVERSYLCKVMKTLTTSAAETGDLEETP